MTSLREEGILGIFEANANIYDNEASLEEECKNNLEECMEKEGSHEVLEEVVLPFFPS
jgi:hypothetical protein